MREVTWGDVLLSAVLTAVFLGLAGALTYLIVNVVDASASRVGFEAIYIAFPVTALAICMLAMRAHQGPKGDFGPPLAWAILVLAIPAAGGIAQVAGIIDADVLWSLVSMWLLQLSFLAPVIVLSVYLNGRDATMTLSEAHARDF